MKPTIPSNHEIAAEFGIVPETPGWKKLCAEKRPQSRLQAEYERALAQYELTDEAREERDYAQAQRVERQALRTKLEAIGCGYLVGAQLITSRRGTVASVSGGKASPITLAACRVLGRKPGPGNY